MTDCELLFKISRQASGLQMTEEEDVMMHNNMANAPYRAALYLLFLLPGRCQL